MTVPATHYPHAIIIPSGPEIVQLNSAEPNANLNELIAHASGDPIPSFTGIMDSAPGFSFGTSQIKDILDEVATDAVIANYSGSNVDVEYREGVSGGTRAAIATTTHLRGRCANASLLFESLSAQQGQPAELRARLAFLSSDGLTNPITWTDGVAITATDKVQHQFTLGPLKLNGSFIGGGQGMEWDNRLTIDEAMADGEVFPTYHDVESYVTQIVYRTRNTALLATYNDPVAITSCTAFLRKKAANGYLVANATEEHIGLTAATGFVKARTASGAKSIVELVLQFNQSAGALFTVDTTAAIA